MSLHVKVFGEGAVREGAAHRFIKHKDIKNEHLSFISLKVA